jgi:hypothetical protein
MPWTAPDSALSEHPCRGSPGEALGLAVPSALLAAADEVIE